MGAGTLVLKSRGGLASTKGKTAVAMIVATALLVGGTYVWQQSRVDRAVSAGQNAARQSAELRNQVAGVQGELKTLNESSRNAADQLRASGHRLARAEAHVAAMLGPPLADGRYFGALVAVGVAQEPPRLVIDLEKYLTGDAATRWEIAHGVPPNERYDNVIENISPAWHTIEIAPNARVSILALGSGSPFRHVGKGLVGTHRISLAEFGDTKGGEYGSSYQYVSPFWINVSNGRVTVIEEQYTS
jgi:hypothetical protein